ncbi:hypothetical protein [Embleya sp. AB8]|uniref:hypothetical protein n=1 Tax=Embleya sp. AB8 TaxID=3156304 RepID=UPI003C70EDFD
MDSRAVVGGFGLVAVLLLAGCGSTDGHRAGATGTGTSAPSLDPAMIERAALLGTTPGMVYVTDVPGFELARQSVAVYGDAGFQATYVSTTGRQIHLAVDAQGAAACPATPPPTPPRESCSADGDAWYRATPTEHTYTRAVAGLVLHLWAAPAEVDRATLRAAALAARPANDAELPAVLPPPERDGPPGPTRPSGSAESAGSAGTTEPSGSAEPATPTAPVRRGDLPPVGDGAPMDPPRLGG